MSAPFVGTTTLQDTIALAVAEFLEKMWRVEGYVEAIRAAEAHQRRQAPMPSAHNIDVEGGTERG